MRRQVHAKRVAGMFSVAQRNSHFRGMMLHITAANASRRAVQSHSFGKEVTARKLRLVNEAPGLRLTSSTGPPRCPHRANDAKITGS